MDWYYWETHYRIINRKVIKPTDIIHLFLDEDRQGIQNHNVWFQQYGAASNFGLCSPEVDGLDVRELLYACILSIYCYAPIYNKQSKLWIFQCRDVKMFLIYLKINPKGHATIKKDTALKLLSSITSSFFL